MLSDEQKELIKELAWVMITQRGGRKSLRDFLKEPLLYNEDLEPNNVLHSFYKYHNYNVSLINTQTEFTENDIMFTQYCAKKFDELVGGLNIPEVRSVRSTLGKNMKLATKNKKLSEIHGLAQLLFVMDQNYLYSMFGTFDQFMFALKQAYGDNFGNFIREHFSREIAEEIINL